MFCGLMVLINIVINEEFYEKDHQFFSYNKDSKLVQLVKICSRESLRVYYVWAHVRYHHSSTQKSKKIVKNAISLAFLWFTGGLGMVHGLS